MPALHRPTVLVVTGNEALGSTVAAALPEVEVVCARGVHSALQVLRSRPVAAVLAEYRLADGTGIDLFRSCRAEYPDAGRVLMTGYEQLPEIVAAREASLFTRVVPAGGDARSLAAVVNEVLAGAPEATATTGGRRFTVSDLGPLLEWTASQAARVRNLVVRELPHAPSEAQLQWVMPARSSLQAFREALVARWRFPLTGREDHPVGAWLGGLSKQAEVFCRKVDGAEVYAYLALLPWQRESKVTCLMGIAAEPPEPRWSELVAAAHAVSLREVATFPIPHVPRDEDASGVGQLVPEYDWVVTASYAGRDRRRGPTAFLGPHAMVRGRRARVPSRLGDRLGLFADRMTPRLKRYLMGYALLTTVDAVCTALFAGGALVELNPIAAGLLKHGPWLFFGVRQGLALAAFVLVARFEHSRVGLNAARALLALFAAVDGWWLWLVLR